MHKQAPATSASRGQADRCACATQARAAQVVRSIDVSVRDVRWSDSGELVALIGEASFYVLRFSREAVDAWLAGGGAPDDDGVQDAFELLNEVSERVRTGAPAPAGRSACSSGKALELLQEVPVGACVHKRPCAALQPMHPATRGSLSTHAHTALGCEARARGAGLWVGDCFIYNNAAWRLNYCVGGEVTTMFHLDRPMYLLGYLASQSRVYLIDKARAPSRPALPCTCIRALRLLRRAGLLSGFGVWSIQSLSMMALIGTCKFASMSWHMSRQGSYVEPLYSLYSSLS